MAGTVSRAMRAKEDSQGRGRGRGQRLGNTSDRVEVAPVGVDGGPEDQVVVRLAGDGPVHGDLRRRSSATMFCRRGRAGKPNAVAGLTSSPMLHVGPPVWPRGGGKIHRSSPRASATLHAQATRARAIFNILATRSCENRGNGASSGCDRAQWNIKVSTARKMGVTECEIHHAKALTPGAVPNEACG